MTLSRRLVLVIGLAVGCVAGASLSGIMLPAARAGTAVPRWEHNCFGRSFSADGVQEDLNKLGAQGWELATVDSRNGVYCMKRAVP